MVSCALVLDHSLGINLFLYFSCIHTIFLLVSSGKQDNGAILSGQAGQALRRATYIAVSEALDKPTRSVL